MAIAGRINGTKFRDQVLKPHLAEDLLALTVPEKPTSSLQKYRLTDKGRTLLVTI